MMKLKPVPAALLSALFMTTPPSIVFADKTVNLDAITVSGNQTNERESKIVQIKDDIVQTEVISAKKIQQKQAGNLAQAIRDEPGVRVSTECSMCGVKRIQLNGLKGEHTTLMINDVPNSSIVEGFYGFDAIPIAGVTSIEIARGAGASLIAPGAIGGVINVVTAKPSKDSLSADFSWGNQDYHKYQVVGTKVSSNNDTQILVAAQSDNIDQYDEDNNDVNESPSLTNQSLVAQVWHQLTAKDQISFRITDLQSEVFGGPMIGSYLASSRQDARSQQPGSSPGFIDNNVNNKPSATSTARDFLENIELTKQAYTGKWFHDFSADTQSRVTASYVDSSMDAIYEPTTYKADQDIYYFDARVDHFINAEHALTIGMDSKQDKMKSKSTGGTQPANDSYNQNNYGLYIRDIWTPTNRLEISLAVRADQINVKFTDQDRKFDDTVIAPRVNIQYDHNFNWTSRLSAGQGYRVPLQFFEADHGILDDGFAVDVDKLEKSNSVRYALAFESARTSFETSYSWTEVSNLTTIDTENYAQPTLVNTSGEGVVQHADISASYQIDGHWSVGATLEGFFYDKKYRSTFGVIPIEERLRLMVDYIGHGWEANVTATGIGERNYKDYTGAAYYDHYNQAGGVDSKGTHSPAFMTVDMQISKDITRHWTVYAGANNLFDYTQTSDGDSPLFYDGANAGSEDWDVGHIWGPLRGRLVYGGIRANF